MSEGSPLLQKHALFELSSVSHNVFLRNTVDTLRETEPTKPSSYEVSESNFKQTILKMKSGQKLLAKSSTAASGRPISWRHGPTPKSQKENILVNGRNSR
jgi:hypothetical protein